MQALQRLDEVLRKRDVRPAFVAALFAEAGDHSRAAEWLARAVAEKDHTLLFLRFDDRWPLLRSSVLYRDALIRAGAEPPSPDEIRMDS